MISRPFPLYTIVESHAISHADSTAVIYEQTKWNYAELNRRANRLAHSLLSKKISPGDTVAVMLEPSAEILVALLAIHKIGAIYVPIDPSFPPARIHAILLEISARLVLTDGPIRVVPSEFAMIACGIAELIHSSEIETNPNYLPSLESLSHIYFTSGTTGRPKGVLSTHDNLVHYVESAIHRYGFNQEDAFIAAARFTFSISMFELMVPLVAGSRVQILPRDTVLNLNKLCGVIKQSTVFHFGPSLLKQLLPYIKSNYETFEAFDGLRHVSSGGDMVPPQVLEDLKTIFRNAEVFVIYGSSEISCMGCTYQVPRDRVVSRTLVGTAHQDMKVRIIGSEGQLAAVDVPGQIYFSGRGLVKGYLNLPELTREKFQLIDGERYYAIGDIGRYDRNGNIELIGREDFQVQIRGMRVELLEVESRLKSHPAIADCVVVGRQLHEEGEKSLVAYIVLNRDATVNSSELRVYVGHELPDYMVPCVFVSLERLPTNHNLKLDRSQLPDPSVENLLVSREIAEPANDVERVILRQWQELFQTEKIGVNHNFFELGGDSLLAVKLLIAIEQEFGLFVPISSMITSPTVREIAKVIKSESKVDGFGDVVVLKKGNTEPPLFCLYGVLLYKDLADCLETPRMVCGVYLQEELALMHKGTACDEFGVFSSVEKIAERYMKSIMAFQPSGPYFLCGESFGGIIALEVARKLQERGQKVDCVAMFDTSTPKHLNSLSSSRRVARHLQLLKERGIQYAKEKSLAYLRSLKSFYQRLATKTADVVDTREAARKLASEKYEPEFYRGDVILLRATERDEFDVGASDLGWADHVQCLDIHNILGDHLGILKRGRVEAIATILGSKLNGDAVTSKMEKSV